MLQNTCHTLATNLNNSGYLYRKKKIVFIRRTFQNIKNIQNIQNIPPHRPQKLVCWGHSFIHESSSMKHRIYTTTKMKITFASIHENTEIY